MKKIAVLTGAGISAESGLGTFRGSGGLWEGYDLNEVATPEGWMKNKSLVLDFYNKRRKNALEAQPNAAHFALAELEQKFEVVIITQNIDNLHERAGSKNIIHLHGEITKSRSTKDSSLVYDIDGWEIKLGDKCEKASQLRPHIVWFGEAVPKMQEAENALKDIDILIVVGTSLQVYPAAGLLFDVPPFLPKYLIDPNELDVSGVQNLTFIQEKASVGLPNLVEKLLKTAEI